MTVCAHVVAGISKAAQGLQPFASSGFNIEVKLRCFSSGTNHSFAGGGDKAEAIAGLSADPAEPRAPVLEASSNSDHVGSPRLHYEHMRLLNSGQFVWKPQKKFFVASPLIFSTN